MSVIIFRYSSSPMWQKVRNVLVIKGIPHSVIAVDGKPPRAELQRLGITYRRIPVMAIGSDLYFDTSLIVSELERRFGPEKGHPALLTVDPGLQEAAVAFWNDRAFFLAAMTMIPKAALTPAMAKDRAEFLGDSAFIDKIDEYRPAGLSTLRSHISLLTSQLESSKTPFLLSTPSLTYIDISIYTIIAWIRSLKTANHIFTLPSSQAALPYRRVMRWYEAVDAAYHVALKDPSNKASKSVQLDSATAKDIISNAVSKPTLKVQVDKSDPLFQAGWVKEGDWVSVTPNDTGKVPQMGILVGLTDKVVSLRVPIPGIEGRSLIAHFPRIGYTIHREKARTAKL